MKGKHTKDVGAHSRKQKPVQPEGKCEQLEDCAPFLRQNIAAVVHGMVTDALNNDRDGRKQFFEMTGLKEHLSRAVFEQPKEERAFVTTAFERDMLEGLRQLADDEPQGPDDDSKD